MADSIFNQPGSGGAFLKPVLGHLILIVKVHEVKEVLDATYNKMVDQAKIDYVDLSEEGQELHVRARSTNIGIVNRLEEGKQWILGRIGQVPTDKGNPAWTLDEYVEGDEVAALAWKQRYDAGQIQQAVAPAAPPVVAAVAPVTPAPVAAPAVDNAAMAALLAGMTPEQRAAIAALNPSAVV